jgi:hypothetical protein
MAARPTKHKAWRGPRRGPFLALSMLLHATLLAALFLWGPQRVKPLAPEQRQARLSAALEQARRKQMQRQVRSLEEIQRKLAAQAGDTQAAADPRAELPSDPQALLKRAQALAEKIQQTQQKTRAAELARLLKIKPEQALAQLQAEEKKAAAARPTAASMKPDTTPPATPAVAIAKLEQQARSVLERQQQREAQRQQGTLITSQRGSQPHPSSAGAAPSGSGKGQGLQADHAGGGASGQGGGDGGGAAGGSATSPGGGFRDPRSYGALSQASAVDGATLRPGAGHVLGAGGPFANRIYLNSWYILGPFEGLSAGSMKEIYPPEVGVDLDAAYEGLGGRVLQWQYQSSAAYPFVPQPRAENAVYFAYAEVMVDAAREVWLEIGADDDSKLWLNDELVWASGNADKPWYRQPFYQLRGSIGQLNLVEGRRRVQLRAGRNTLLFKLYNGIDLMFFAVVINPQINP